MLESPVCYKVLNCSSSLLSIVTVQVQNCSELFVSMPERGCAKQNCKQCNIKPCDFFVVNLCVNFPCSILQTGNVLSVSHILACVKRCKTVAFMLQAQKHITCHTPHTRLPRAAFLSAAHRVLHVDHLWEMCSRGCAN